MQHWIERLLGPRRHVLIHAHLFKNAGTTFDFSLRHSFGEQFVDHRDDAGMKRGAAYLGPWLEANPSVTALSSHWITPPLPQVSRTRLHCCVLLRDPIERCASVYRFERAQQGVETPGSRRAKELDFVHYMQWQMRPTPGPAVKNYQVRYCSGNYLGARIEDMYERALHWLQHVPLVGLVHRYDESMVLFEERLKPFFPDLDLAYRVQNVSRGDGNSSLAERREQVLQELTNIAGLKEKVLQRNQYDIQLFDAVQARFDEQWAAVVDREEKLGTFRTRVAALAQDA